MPLLDRLKTVHPPPPMSGLSLAEEWMSLSAAIGMNIDPQPLPGPSQPLTSRAMPDIKPNVEDMLWTKLLEVCPEDLVDQ